MPIPIDKLSKTSSLAHPGSELAARLVTGAGAQSSPILRSHHPTRPDFTCSKYTRSRWRIQARVQIVCLCPLHDCAPWENHPPSSLSFIPGIPPIATQTVHASSSLADLTDLMPALLAPPLRSIAGTHSDAMPDAPMSLRYFVITYAIAISFGRSPGPL